MSQSAEYKGCVARCPCRCKLLMPFKCYPLKGVSLCYRCLFRGSADLSRIDTVSKALSSLFPLSTCIREGNFTIRTKAKPLLLPLETVFEIPALAANGLMITKKTRYF